MEINRTAIRRTTNTLPGQAALLLLRTGQTCEAHVLDAAIPADDRAFLASGGWFLGPVGWTLLVDGLDDHAEAWLEQLAANLHRAGIDGALTGAPPTGNPVWARDLPVNLLYGLTGHQPRVGASWYAGWMPSRQTLSASIDLSAYWLTRHEASLVAAADLRSRFCVNAPGAAHIMTGDVVRGGDALALGYDEARQEVRYAHVLQPACTSLATSSARMTWLEHVDELRTALVSQPLEDVTIAMLSPAPWSSLQNAPSGDDEAHGRAYDYHPERWHEFTLDPVGIQILTNTHLAKASDLSAWTTTRLDADHTLVEARDLEPWYAGAPNGEPVDPAVLEQARRDFGDMILTVPRARELGLDAKPPRR